jgi:hypothetical protein
MYLCMITSRMKHRKWYKPFSTVGDPFHFMEN